MKLFGSCVSIRVLNSFLWTYSSIQLCRNCGTSNYPSLYKTLYKFSDFEYILSVFSRILTGKIFCDIDIFKNQIDDFQIQKTIEALAFRPRFPVDIFEQN